MALSPFVTSIVNFSTEHCCCAFNCSNLCRAWSGASVYLHAVKSFICQFLHIRLLAMTQEEASLIWGWGWVGRNLAPGLVTLPCLPISTEVLTMQSSYGFGYVIGVVLETFCGDGAFSFRGRGVSQCPSLVPALCTCLRSVLTIQHSDAEIQCGTATYIRQQGLPI